MAFLRRKKLDIRVPTGQDAVNFRKLLFLPIKDTEDLLSNKEWDRVRLHDTATHQRVSDATIQHVTASLTCLPLAVSVHLPSSFFDTKLDLRCLTLMKTKMLRASCIARGLVKKGGKKKLVQRLSVSLAEQKNAGAILLSLL